MLHIAICEDEPYSLNHLLKIILNNKKEVELDYAIYPSGKDLLVDYYPAKYDLIFIEINSNESNGIQTVSKIRTIDPNVCITFTTSSTDYALDGYRLNVIKYIEKPVNEKEVADAIKLAYLKKQDHSMIRLFFGRHEHTYLSEQITYAEQKDHTIQLFFTDGTSLLFTGKLDDISKYFPIPTFYRCHKSFLVNLTHVDHIDTEFQVFVMKNGANVYIRRRNMKEATIMLNHFLVHT